VAALIRLEVEEKRFGSDVVLGRLSLHLPDGEFIALLGPSGAGKTTLLRMLAGLDRDFRGELVTDSEAAQGPACGFLFQEARLMPWLTALKNLALVTGDEERARAALASVGLAEAADRYPHQLSGGMQRRVALARAVVCEPRLLLLDEPFVSLDQPNAATLRGQLLEHWRQSRPTVVLVSHDLDEALELADRIVFLGGRPATVVHEEPVTLTRPRDSRDATLSGLRRRLLERHPELLRGQVGDRH
jgi:NitT/TauT family transport system ATP-binding protein